MKESLFRLDLRDQRSRRLKHERLKAHLVGEMVAGRLRPGDMLPSESSLSEALGITRPTIRQAMASLETDGLIRRVQGKGNFVQEDARRKLKRGLDVLALVVPETRAGFYPSLLHGFEEAASGFRHQMVVCNTGDDLARQGDIMLQLLDQGVGGVALVPISQSITPVYQIRQLQDRGIPLVFCHRRVEGVAAPLLALPYRDVGRMAGKLLVEHGHHHVAFFGTRRSPAMQGYEDGLNEVLQANGCRYPAEAMYVVKTVILDEAVILEGLKKVFTRPNVPTAIFAGFDSLAEMIYMLLPRLGLRIPEDVSLVGFGGAWREGAIIRRLTSVVVDEIATGQQAASLLYEMRRGQRPIDDNERRVLELTASNGQTLAASPASKHRVHS
jgi:GntR family transcriptional regulator, arabinose operon transcriptional repressor